MKRVKTGQGTPVVPVHVVRLPVGTGPSGLAQLAPVIVPSTRMFRGGLRSPSLSLRRSRGP
jgi:hypothetical protein